MNILSVVMRRKLYLLTCFAAALVIFFQRQLVYFAKTIILEPDVWQTLGKVPRSKSYYPPQGLTYADGNLVFSNHLNDTKSELFLIDPDNMEVVTSAFMPNEATHTSGLAWDGMYLWAVDYNSNYLYKLDFKKTFQSGVAHILNKYNTNLKGASALTVITLSGECYLAISDFQNSGTTYIIELNKIEKLRSKSLSEASMLEYNNQSFSQGLMWDGVFLYESVNKIGTDQINVYNVQEAISEKNSELISRHAVISAPAQAVEDLATDGVYLWTSDESTFRFYRMKL